MRWALLRPHAGGGGGGFISWKSYNINFKEELRSENFILTSEMIYIYKYNENGHIYVTITGPCRSINLPWHVVCVFGVQICMHNSY